MWWRSAVNRSFLLCLAACRMRSSAWDTPARSCARSVLCWPAFPLVPALRSTNSAAVGTALFVGFSRRMPPAFVRIATISGSDFSCPCIIGFGSSPSRRGPDSPKAIRSDARSPGFRSVPFVRDGVVDHDGVSVPCIAAPHRLPSAPGDGLGLHHFQNIRGSISHPTQLLCKLRGRRRRRATQHSLPGGLLALTRSGLAPAGSDQLILPHLPSSGRSLVRNPRIRERCSLSK